MTRVLDWYFDFLSPYSYLQSELLPNLPADIEVRYQPVLLAGLLNHWESKGPAEIPPKRQAMFMQIAWLARQHGIPITMPPHHPFNTLPLLRLCIALGCTREVVQRLFRWVWQEGHLPTDAAAWAALLQELGATTQVLELPDVKQQLRNNGAAALAAGVFGVPTAVIDGRCFWGLDSMEMLLAYLRGDPFFMSDALRRAQCVPLGVQRQPPSLPPQPS